MNSAELFECFATQLSHQHADVNDAVERWLYRLLGEPVFDGVNLVDVRVNQFGDLAVCGSVWALETQRLHPFEFTLARGFDGWVQAALCFGDEAKPEGYAMGKCIVMLGLARAWRVRVGERSRLS